MTPAIEKDLGLARRLTTAARDAFATETADDSDVAAILDTVVEGCNSLTRPEADHIEGGTDQRAYNLARLLEHANRLLCEVRSGDRRLGAEIIALVLAAAVKLDAVCIALENQQLRGWPDTAGAPA